MRVVHALVALLPLLANATYMEVDANKERCFVESLAKDELLMGDFQVQHGTLKVLNDELRGAGHPKGKEKHTAMRIRVRGPKGKKLVEKFAFAQPSEDEAAGEPLPPAPRVRFAYTAKLPGEHRICVGTNATSHPAHSFFSSSGGAKTKLMVKFDLGTMEEGHTKEDKEKHVAAKKLKTGHLEDGAPEVTKMHVDDMLGRVEALQMQLLGMQRMMKRNRDMEEEVRDLSERNNERIVWLSVFQALLLLLSGTWQVYHLKAYFRSKKLV